MKCQIPFSVKKKQNITNLSSAELAQRVVTANKYIYNLAIAWMPLFLIGSDTLCSRFFTISAKGDNFFEFPFAFVQTKFLLKRNLL